MYVKGKKKKTWLSLQCSQLLRDDEICLGLFSLLFFPRAFPVFPFAPRHLRNFPFQTCLRKRSRGPRQTRECVHAFGPSLSPVGTGQRRLPWQQGLPREFTEVFQCGLWFGVFCGLLLFWFVCFVFTDLIMMRFVSFCFFFFSVVFLLPSVKKNEKQIKQKRGKQCKTQHNPPADLFCQIFHLLLSVKCVDLAVWGTNFCCWLQVCQCLLVSLLLMLFCLFLVLFSFKKNCYGLFLHVGSALAKSMIYISKSESLLLFISFSMCFPGTLFEITLFFISFVYLFSVGASKTPPCLYFLYILDNNYRYIYY